MVIELPSYIRDQCMILSDPFCLQVEWREHPLVLDAGLKPGIRYELRKVEARRWIAKEV